MTRSSLRLVAMAICLAVACKAGARPDSTAARAPQPNDSLVKLILKQFSDPDPRRVHMQVLCEGMRLNNTYGYAEGDRLNRDAWARAWDSQDRAERYRVERALVGHDYRINQAICDSVSQAGKGLPPDSAR